MRSLSRHRVGGMKGAVDQIVAHDKIAILTDEVNTPRAIARELIERGRDGYTRLSL